MDNRENEYLKYIEQFGGTEALKDSVTHIINKFDLINYLTHNVFNLINLESNNTLSQINIVLALLNDYNNILKIFKKNILLI